MASLVETIDRITCPTHDKDGEASCSTPYAAKAAKRIKLRILEPKVLRSPMPSPPAGLYDTLKYGSPHLNQDCYECVTEFNTNASFAGNSNDGTGEFDDAPSAGGRSGPLKLSKEVASAFLLAAETTKAKFPIFTFDASKKEPFWIKQMFGKIKALAAFMDEEGHGVHLQGRHDKQTKLEMELKEMIRPSVAYLGTYYMAVRKSAIYKHLQLLTMMYDKNLHMSQYDNCRCIYTGRHCGTYYQEVVINSQPVECDRLSLELERDGYRKMIPVTGQPVQSASRLAAFAQKSSMKIKCAASYMDTSSSSSSSNNDMLDVGMMGLNYGGNHHHHTGGIPISLELKNDIELKLFKAVYPVHSKLSVKQRNEQLPQEKRLKKLDDFLNKNPTIAIVLSHIDYARVVISNWEEFLDVFITHYLLNKYNYNPVELSRNNNAGNNKKGRGGEEKKPGQHKLLKVVHMSEDIEGSGGINFSGSYINRDLLTSQALAVTTRIYPNAFHSEKINNTIYQFRIGESNGSGFSGLLDMPIFSTPHHAAFAVVLRGPYMSNKEFNLSQLFKDIKELDTAVERIKLINSYAQNLYTYIASSCGYGDDSDGEMLTADVGIDLVVQIDAETGILTNPQVADAFRNVFDNYKADNDKYREVYGQILDRAEKEKSQITYIADDDDDVASIRDRDDEAATDYSSKKKKRRDDDGDDNHVTKKAKTEAVDDLLVDDEFNAI